MAVIKQSESTASLRRIYFTAVDTNDFKQRVPGIDTWDVLISKNGGAAAAATNTPVEVDASDMPGVYYLELTATEVNTLGTVLVWVRGEETAGGVDMEVRELEVQVVAYNPFDTVRLGLTALPNAAAEASGGLYTRGTGAGQINQAVNGSIDANLVRWASQGVATQNVAFGWVFSTGGQVAQGGSSTTITLHSGASTTDDLYNGSYIFIYSGAGVGQGRYITDYVGSTRVATVDEAWVVSPDNTSVFMLWQRRAPSVSNIADAVWDEARSGHVAPGSFGEGVNIYDFFNTGPGITYLAAFNAVRRFGVVEATSDSTHVDFLESVGDDVFNGMWIYIYSGTGNGQIRQITDWDNDGGGAGYGRATITPAWDTNPANNDGMVIFVGTPTVGVEVDNSAIADAVWDEARAGHVASGSFGEGVTVAGFLSSALSALADAVWDEVMENAKTARQWMRGFKSALWGKLAISGTSRVFRDDADTKARITATVGPTGRQSITEDLS